MGEIQRATRSKETSRFPSHPFAIIADDLQVIAERALSLPLPREQSLMLAIFSGLLHEWGVREKGAPYVLLAESTAKWFKTPLEDVISSFYKLWNSPPGSNFSEGLEVALALPVLTYRHAYEDSAYLRYAEDSRKFISLVAEDLPFKDSFSRVLEDLAQNILAYADVASFMVKYFEVNGGAVERENRSLLNLMRVFKGLHLSREAVVFLHSAVEEFGNLSPRDAYEELSRTNLEEVGKEDLEILLKKMLALASHPETSKKIRLASTRLIRRFAQRLLLYTDSPKFFSEISKHANIIPPLLLHHRKETSEGEI